MPLSPDALLNANAMRSREAVEAFSSTVTELNAAWATVLALAKFIRVCRDAAFLTMALMTCRCRAARPKSPCASA